MNFIRRASRSYRPLELVLLALLILLGTFLLWSVLTIRSREQQWQRLNKDGSTNTPLKGTVEAVDYVSALDVNDELNAYNDQDDTILDALQNEERAIDNIGEVYDETSY